MFRLIRIILNELNRCLQLFKWRIALSIQWIAQLVFLLRIDWIVIYPMDSATQLFKNWGLEGN